MTHPSAHLTVTIERVGSGRFTAFNSRGGQLAFGGDQAGFTPTELLLAAIGGCTAVDVDVLASRRAEPQTFAVAVEADKIRDADGNRLAAIEVTYRVTFPAGEAGEAARALLPDVVSKSHDRLCTVSRTVELGTPVSTRIG